MKKIISIILIVSMLFLVPINTTYAADTLDSILREANQFITEGENESPINKAELKNTTDFLYNTLLGIAMVIAAGVGIVLGIKYMAGSLDEKATTKQQLVGYAISCVVIFGAFGIWSLVVNILSGISGA